MQNTSRRDAVLWPGSHLVLRSASGDWTISGQLRHWRLDPVVTCISNESLVTTRDLIFSEGSEIS